MKSIRFPLIWIVWIIAVVFPGLAGAEAVTIDLELPSAILAPESYDAVRDDLTEPLNVPYQIKDNYGDLEVFFNNGRSEEDCVLFYELGTEQLAPVSGGFYFVDMPTDVIPPHFVSGVAHLVYYKNNDQLIIEDNCYIYFFVSDDKQLNYSFDLAGKLWSVRCYCNSESYEYSPDSNTWYHLIRDDDGFITGTEEADPPMAVPMLQLNVQLSEPLDLILHTPVQNDATKVTVTIPSAIYTVPFDPETGDLAQKVHMPYEVEEYNSNWCVSFEWGSAYYSKQEGHYDQPDIIEYWTTCTFLTLSDLFVDGSVEVDYEDLNQSGSLIPCDIFLTLHDASGNRYRYY